MGPGRAGRVPSRGRTWLGGPACATHGFPFASSHARGDLYRVIGSAITNHEPVQITGKRGCAVLVGESDWRAIQETLHLLGMPGMRESIVEGMAESPKSCSREIDL